MEIESKSHCTCTGISYSDYSQPHNYEHFLKSEVGTLGCFCGRGRRHVETVHHIFTPLTWDQSVKEISK